MAVHLFKFPSLFMKNVNDPLSRFSASKDSEERKLRIAELLKNFLSIRLRLRIAAEVAESAVVFWEAGKVIQPRKISYHSKFLANAMKISK